MRSPSLRQLAEASEGENRDCSLEKNQPPRPRDRISGKEEEMKKAEKMFFISLPRMGEGWWFCGFSVEEAEKRLIKESGYDSNQSPKKSATKLTLMEWDVAPLRQYIIAQASGAWEEKEEFGRKLPPGYQGEQSYYELQGRIVSYFHLHPSLLPVAKDDHLNGFVVVDWLKENFPPVSKEASFFNEIETRINLIKNEVKLKTTDFNFVKSVEVNSEAIGVMADCAFLSAINPQTDNEKRMIMEEYHPIYKEVPVSFAALTYVQICGRAGFKLAATPRYRECLGADALVEYVQPGYAAVCMNKEFWVIKIDDPKKAVMGNMDGPYTHGIYNRESTLLVDAIKLFSLREAGKEVVVITQ